MKHINKRLTAIASIVIFGIGVMLSCNVFAAKKNYATAEALDTEIADRIAGDAALQSQIEGIDALPDIPSGGFDEVSLLKLCIGSETPQWEPCSYEIGDTGPAGGLVFYVTDGGVHGMEAAPSDQGRALWGCYGTSIPKAQGTAVGTGAQNTVEILKACSESPIAAELAANYSPNGFSGWFLPSKDELNLMWLNLADSDGDGNIDGKDDPNNLGNFWGDYWSSSEGHSESAWLQVFAYEILMIYTLEKNQLYHPDLDIHIRAIRVF